MISKPSRLFDLLQGYVDRQANKEMLFAKINKQWQGIASSQVLEQSLQLAASFRRMGMSGHDMTVEKQDKIGIIANNRPEWIITDFAVQQVGAVLVPIYPSITDKEWQYIINESQISILFISDKFIYRKLQAILEHTPSLKHVYCFEFYDRCFCSFYDRKIFIH